MEREIKYRMYFLVPYNISPIQQAIQAGHSVVEYANKYFNDEDYQSWAINDKTFIILSGGTTNKSDDYFGTLNQHLRTLIDNNIKLASFNEPDLGDQLTAICFLVEDKVYDKVKYPDFDQESVRFIYQDYETWRNNIGEKNVFLRNFLSTFKLA
jgi:hypothetical protein